MTFPSLTSRILSIISSANTPAGNSNPFGEVDAYLVALYFVDVPDGFLVVIYICSGLLGILALLSVACLVVRYKKSNCVFVTRQGGFIVPGTATLFLIAWTGFVIVLQIFLWKSVRGFTRTGSYLGTIPLQSLTWSILGYTAYAEVWGLLCAANFSPHPMRSFQPSTTPSFLSSFKILANRNDRKRNIDYRPNTLPVLNTSFRLQQNRDRSIAGSRTSMLSNSSLPRPYLSPLAFNLIFVCFLPLSFFALMFLQGAMGTKWCERNYRQYQIAEGITNAAKQTNGDDPDSVVQRLLVPLAEMDELGPKCHFWVNFYYALVASWTAAMLIGGFLAGLLLSRQMQARIQLLEEASGKRQRRCASTVALSPRLSEQTRSSIIPSSSISDSALEVEIRQVEVELNPIDGREKPKSGKASSTSSDPIQVEDQLQTQTSCHSHCDYSSFGTPPLPIPKGSPQHAQRSSVTWMDEGKKGEVLSSGLRSGKKYDPSKERKEAAERASVLRRAKRNLGLQVAGLMTACVAYFALSWTVFATGRPNTPSNPIAVGIFFSIIDFGIPVIVGYPVIIALLFQGLQASPNQGSFIGNHTPRLPHAANEGSLEDEDDCGEEIVGGFAHSEPPLHRSVFVSDDPTGGERGQLDMLRKSFGLGVNPRPTSSPQQRWSRGN